MKIIDLTHTLRPDISVYPGTPQPRIHPFANYEEKGYREAELTFASHIGTHIDAPAHMLKDGETLDLLPLERFAGNGICIAVNDEYVRPEHLKNLPEAEVILFYTDWSRHWNSEQYHGAFPTFLPETVDEILRRKPRLIGIDAPSVDAVASDYGGHRKLLGAGILMVENLTGLEQLVNKDFHFTAAPLKWEHADGAPVRAFAVIK